MSAASNTLLRLPPRDITLRHVEATFTNPDYRDFMLEQVERAYDRNDPSIIAHALELRTYPVHVEEFLFGKNYLGRPRDEMYPEVVSELVNINEGNGRLLNRLTEAVLTGGIGSAKTTTALYTNAYQLYLLSCYKNPHRAFGMDSTSEIVFIFQSLSAQTAKDVDYARFRAICEQSYYFTRTFPFRKDYQSAIKFNNRIEVKPIGSDGGSIGQNVVGGLIDEVNFMSVVEKSKKKVDGGVYDQAKVIYDSVSRRIKTRFVNSGGMPGILCLVSSRHYPGEFTDGKLAEAATDPTIYVYDKCVWDVKPPGTYCGQWFRVFAGDETRKPRILKDEEQLSDEDLRLVRRVPVEYLDFFKRDIIGSLRDIAGVSTMARFPFILNTESVANAFGKRQSLLSKEAHDFDSGTKLDVYPKRIKHPECPRWVHMDLSTTGDCTGVAVGFCSGFKATRVNGVEEQMPIIEFDLILQVVPPKGDEIQFHKIRELLFTLRKLGLPLKWATCDSHQSTDNLQLLRQAGLIVGRISTDTTTLPYEFAKAAFYDDRLRLPAHADCQREFVSLEKDQKKNKIDHPPSGSKDCSDAVASVIYGLTTRREVWAQYNIPVVRTPEVVRTAQQKDEKL